MAQSTLHPEKQIATEKAWVVSDATGLRLEPPRKPPRRLVPWGAGVLLVVGLGIGIGVGLGGGTTHQAPRTTGSVVTVTMCGHQVATRELNPTVIGPFLDTATAHRVFCGG